MAYGGAIPGIGVTQLRNIALFFLSAGQFRVPHPGIAVAARTESEQTRVTELPEMIEATLVIRAVRPRYESAKLRRWAGGAQGTRFTEEAVVCEFTVPTIGIETVKSTVHVTWDPLIEQE